MTEQPSGRSSPASNSKSFRPPTSTRSRVARPTEAHDIDSPVLVSTSAATDGAWHAIADVTRVLKSGEYRLLGGLAVMIHLQRHSVAIAPRATADADIGVPPSALLDDGLTRAVASLGYSKVAGNRWERPVGESTAAIDLLVPAYTSRARSSVQIGSTNTTEVPGLALAFKRPPVTLDVRLITMNGESTRAYVSIPDEASMLAMKLLVRSVRNEQRDAEDIERCLEILAVANGAALEAFRSGSEFADARRVLARELSEDGVTRSTVLGRRPDARTWPEAAAAWDQHSTRLTALRMLMTG